MTREASGFSTGIKLNGEKLSEGSSKTPSYKKYSDDAYSIETKDGTYSIGTKVLHAKFGSGIVLNLSGNEENLGLEVFFKAPYGKKKLSANHAKLIIL